jgi:putative ubiquitin-RnfH superfamily antitoxin RatB of RatAB toxin-antitoxin module
MGPADEPALSVEVIFCAAPGQSDAVTLRLPPGASLGEAVAASGLCQRHQLDAPLAGIWGHVRPQDTLLRDGDRVELYRPLRVDPKEARRLRYKRAAARKR